MIKRMKMSQEKNYEGLLELAKEYYTAAKEVEKNKPYHINIIEELHINENAHSRILAKLLKYQNEKGEYVFLESLLAYIKQNVNDNFPVIIKAPKITQEKDRIDLLVWDEEKKYAIIVENKIYGAQDRKEQLSRYIDNVKTKKNIEPKNIYIVYLTKDHQSPSPSTWKSKQEEKVYRSRFCNLSYMQNILRWLEEDVKKTIPKNQPELQSAIDQYIGYLIIIKKDIDMSEDLKNFFDNHYKEIKDKDISRLQKIVDDFKQIQLLKDGYIEYIKDSMKSRLDKWKTYDEVVCTDNSELSAVKLKTNNKEYWLYLRLDDNCQKILCVFERTDGRIPSAFTEIKKCLPKGTQGLRYKEWDLDDLTEALNIFDSILTFVTKNHHLCDKQHR